VPKRTERRQRLFELAATQAGYFTAAQARALGYTTRSLVYHGTRGRFERVSRGFYRLLEFPALPHEDVIAAWVQVGRDRAVVSHDTALALYELAQTRSREIHLTVPREHRPRHLPARRHLRIHTTKKPLRPAEIVRRFGVQLTSPARTIADSADIGADPSVIIEATARALNSGLVTAAELRQATRDRSPRVRQLIERTATPVGRRARVR
jgi:predicted transcriptional regulator of viral defense system